MSDMRSLDHFKLIVLAVFAFVLLMSVVGAGFDRTYGDPDTNTSYEADGYYEGHSQDESNSNSVVSAVVFDFRGLDTLGEATVLFTAVLGVSLALRRWRHG